MRSKLSPQDLQAFACRLRALHGKLVDDIEHIEESLLGIGGLPADRQGDDGNDDWSVDVDLELLAQEGGTVNEVREALRRIEAGTFGRCETCGSAITLKRLRELPHARDCATCAVVAERESPTVNP